MHDLVIKGGNVVDGTGVAARTADVAITDGVVTEVGRVDGVDVHGDEARLKTAGRPGVGELPRDDAAALSFAAVVDEG